jgi:hypothetical protein
MPTPCSPSAKSSRWPAGQKEAAAELEKALALYERKGNVVMADRVRVHIEELRATTARN